MTFFDIWIRFYVRLLPIIPIRPVLCWKASQGSLPSTYGSIVARLPFVAAKSCASIRWKKPPWTTLTKYKEVRRIFKKISTIFGTWSRFFPQWTSPNGLFPSWLTVMTKFLVFVFHPISYLFVSNLHIILKCQNENVIAICSLMCSFS